MGWLRWVGSSGVVVALASAAGPSLPGAGRQETTLVRGRQLFRTYCASCHGVTGRGDGPMVEYLRVPPANLPLIAARNQGVFPAEGVRRAIDGRRAVRAHGDSAMPIWGDALLPRERNAAERIRDLVAYLDVIQERLGD